VSAKRKSLPKPQTLFNPVLPAQIDPEPFLNLTKPQPSRALIDSALYQIEFGHAETAMLYKSVVGGEQYNALLRWGYSLVSRAMSPNEVMTALHSLALTAVAVGWVAGGSGVQSALLNHLVSPMASSSRRPKTSNDGGKPEAK
jgi:hypothetical protein